LESNGAMSEIIKIPDKVGIRELQDLFKKFIRERRLPCETCPHRFNCDADLGCFQHLTTEFLFWLKNRVGKKENKG